MNPHGLSLAQVVRYYPESNSADIIRIEDGWRAPRVPVMCGQASSTSGLHQVVGPNGISATGVRTADDARDVIAVLGYHGAGAPIIMGFLPPAVRETLFADGRYINRLESDVYTSVDAEGNFEWSHPSGAFIRVAETPDHEDLTGKDFNGRWAIRKNTQRQPFFRVSIGNNGETRGTITIDPTGAMRFEAPGGYQLVAPITSIDGDLFVSGALFAAEGIRSGSFVADIAGTLAQVRLAHDLHFHASAAGPTTVPMPASPPSVLPPRAPDDIEQEQQAEDAYVPSTSMRDDNFVPITLPQYIRGMDERYPDDYTPAIVTAATALLVRINALLLEAGINRLVTSGWRPLAYNLRVPRASATSLHIRAHAIDLGDEDRRLMIWLARNPAALERNGLYLESPAATPTWVHLQDIAPDSGRRVFLP